MTQRIDLPMECPDKQVAPYGGTGLMKRFVGRTGIRDFPEGLDLPRPQSNRGHGPAHIMESFWLGARTGASRYAHWATEASFRFFLVAYSLIGLFRHFALNHDNRIPLKALKDYCFALGGMEGLPRKQTGIEIRITNQKRPWMEGIFPNIQNLTRIIHPEAYNLGV